MSSDFFEFENIDWPLKLPKLKYLPISQVAIRRFIACSLQPATLLKIDPTADFLLYILRNFQNGTRKTSTRKITTQMIPTGLFHPENSHLGKFSPRITPTGTIAPRKIPIQVSSHPENSYPG